MIHIPSKLKTAGSVMIKQVKLKTKKKKKHVTLIIIAFSSSLEFQSILSYEIKIIMNTFVPNFKNKKDKI